MSNHLKSDKKLTTIHMLVEGNSIHSTSRLTGVHRDTIGRLLLRVGAHCQELLDQHIQGVRASVIECDEYWTFIRKKQYHLTDSERALGLDGDWWVYTALDCDSRLVISHLVGKRDAETTRCFIRDLRARVVGRPELYTDGLDTYVDAIEQAFGTDLKCHAQLVKNMSGHKLKSLDQRTISGVPSRPITTSYVERHNLTARTNCKRFTRKTNAHSKRLRFLQAATALHYAWYNFVRVHSTLRVTPAMQAGLASEVWDLERLIPMRVASYKPQKNSKLGQHQTCRLFLLDTS
ncbi:MAG: DDE-type integrase/transposase/recombinase [Dehalococcoidales bacterium]